VQDKEPKFGLVVVGFVDPARALTKGGARPGDRLVLTKPLGFGVTTTALKREIAAAEDVAEVTAWMKRLNRSAGELALDLGLRGATDITGYSLLGHAVEMSRASGALLRFSFSQIPFISCAQKYADQWTFPGGAADNSLFFKDRVRFAPSLSETEQMMLFDPQTSGGLLLAVPAEKLDNLLSRAAALEQPAWVIGEVLTGQGVEVEA
jgi:selenide,water dikinase